MQVWGLDARHPSSLRGNGLQQTLKEQEGSRGGGAQCKKRQPRSKAEVLAYDIDEADEEDKGATTNVQNGSVFCFFSLPYMFYSLYSLLVCLNKTPKFEEKNVQLKKYERV